MQELEPRIKLTLTHILALICIFGTILAGYAQLRSEINDLKKDAGEVKEYRVKTDLKLDKILDNVTQIRLDAANQRVIDAENKQIQ